MPKARSLAVIAAICSGQRPKRLTCPHPARSFGSGPPLPSLGEGLGERALRRSAQLLQKLHSELIFPLSALGLIQASGGTHIFDRLSLVLKDISF
jgi:hypothetical protein